MGGIGYDRHRLVDGRKLIIGGVKFEYPKGLLGYSDGDVLIHAIVDALLGAAKLGDIGQHFPSNDQRFKNISSIEILMKVRTFLERSGLYAKNIDAIIIAENPKMLPSINAMKEKIGTALKISASSISIKGKTNEGLGPIGTEEAIAACAICELDSIYDTTQG